MQEEKGQGKKGLLVDGLKTMKQSMRRIFGSSFGITTALFMIIWFANALTYYGEVLLTTAVILRLPYLFVCSSIYTITKDDHPLLGALLTIPLTTPQTETIVCTRGLQLKY